MPIKDLGVWVKSAVESFFELKDIRKCNGVTKAFVVDWLKFTTKERDWTRLTEKVQTKLVGLELTRLKRRKKIREAGPMEYIHRDKIYVVVK